MAFLTHASLAVLGAAALAVVAVDGVPGVAPALGPGQVETVGPVSQPPSEQLRRLAQSYSSKCVSSAGICIVSPPQPIGSACWCAGAPGTISP